MSDNTRVSRGSKRFATPILMRAVVAASLLAGASRAGAATLETYVGVNGGSYGTGTNWSPNNTVPSTSAFDALINSGVSVTLNINATVDMLTITSGSGLVFVNGTSYTITGGTLSNSGVISLGATGNVTDLIFTGNSLLTGSGTVSLGNSGNNRIYSSDSAQITIGSNQLIQGAGQLGAGSASVVNNGTVMANLSAGLLIQSNTVGFTNNGLLLATAGSTLTLRGQTFTNNSIIEAADLSLVSLDSGVTISGGTLTTLGSGQIGTAIGNTASLNNVTISAGSNYFAANASTTTVGGTLTNNGTFTFQATGNPTNISLNGAAVDFAGTGVFVMANGNALINGGGTLTIEPAVTIQGSGVLSNIAIKNKGLILANNTNGALSISPVGVGVTNAGGVIRATGGATMFLNSGLYNNSGGTITADAGSAVRLNNGANISGGIFASTGTGQIVVAVSQTVALANLTIAAGSLVNSENNSTTDLSGVITNNGLFTLSATGNPTDLRINGNTEFAGTGSFTLGNNGLNIVHAANSFDILTVDASMTIQGAGSLGSGQMSLINNGTITANQPVGLVLQPSNATASSGYVNNSLMQASSGSTLFLRAGNFFNNKTIRANDTSFVRLDNSVTVSGGTLTTAGSGQIITTQGQLATLNNVTISSGSNYLVENNSVTRAVGTLTNNGIFTFQAGGNITDINTNSTTVEFAGTGVFILAGNTNALIDGGGTLTIDPAITIQGTGQLTNIGIKNTGLILANNTNSGLFISPLASGVINTGGIIRATGGATMFLTGGNYINTGGTITAAAASAVRLSNSITVNGGLLSTTGDGQIISSLNQNVNLNNVTIGAGSNFLAENNSTTTIGGGTLTNNGTFTFQAAGNVTNISLASLPVEFAGTGVFVMTNANAQINGGGTLTIDPGITIEGTGALTNIAINNKGRILANSPLSGLTIAPTGVGLNNAGGLVEAALGNTISFAGGVVTNTGGTLTADTGSAISLSNITVNGGVFVTTGTGQIISAAGQNVTLNNVTITAGSNYVVGNNSTTTIGGGTLTNNGTFTFQAAGNVTNISLASLPVEFAGTGVFVMTNGNAQINGGGALTIDHGITIEGTGALTNIAINNKGLILANSTLSGLTIAPTGSGLNNAGGIVEAAVGNTISFTTGVVTNTGGTLTADTGSAISLSNVTVNGGVFVTTGTGQIISAAGQFVTLNNTTITAGSNYVEGNNNTTTIGGTLTNNGTYTFQATGNPTNITLASLPVEFAGTGVFIMSNGNALINGGGTLTIDPAITIQGTGQLTNIGIINKGLILANDPTSSLTIAPNASNFNNAGGIVRATGGATLFLGGASYANTGGTITADTASAVRLNFNTSITGGLLSSVGTGQIAIVAGGGASLANVTIAAGSLVNAENNTTTNLSGVITNNGSFTISATGNPTDLRILGNTEFAGTGSFTLGNSTLDTLHATAGEMLTVDSGVTIQGGGNLGNGQTGLTNAGTFIANVSTPLLVTANTSNLNNTGTLIATNGATMNVTSLQQDSSSTLTAGTYKAFANSTLTIVNGFDVTTNNASVFLSGAGSIFARINTLAINNGNFHLLAGRKFAPVGDFVNNGILELGDSTLNTGGATFDMTTHNFTNNTNGLIVGFGYFNGRPLNHGTVEAKGGTLAFSNGINGGSGTIQSDTGSTLDLSAGTSGSNGDLLIINGSLTLGANNVRVLVNYTNAAFGVGNSFNKHANVTGTGLILADGTNVQVLTGNVGAGDQANPTMDFQHIHVGGSVSLPYQINNIGAVPASGPSVLYAVQTSVNGGNLTDARLTGTGVTAQNVGPITLGTASSPLFATFTGLTAGSLTTQSVHVANNFDGNTAHPTGPLSLFEQTLSFSGAAYRFAAPLVQGTPLHFGPVHVGDVVPIGHFSLSNTVPNDGFSEKLNGSLSAVTGPVLIAGSDNLLAPGATDSTSFSVSVASTATAGHFTGSATLNLVSDGTGTSGLPSTTLNPVTLTADVIVFRLADALLTNNPVSFNNHHLGDVVTQSITVLNNVPADGFSEKLDGTLSGPGTDNTFAGNFTLLAPNATTGITATLNTSTVGSHSGSVTMSFVSDGNGTSGLPSTPRPAVSLTSSGTVFRFAAPQISPTPISFGNHHVGETVSQSIPVSNIAANDGFSEKLDGTLSGITVPGSFTGNFLLLAPAATTNITAALDTSAAGSKSASATLTLVSDGTGTSGLPSTPRSTVTLSSSGSVYRFASPGTLSGSINLGIIHVNDTTSAHLLIANLSAADGFSEQLGAKFTTITGNVSTSGGPILVNAGSTNSTGLALTLNTSTAQLGRTGTATVHYTSNGTVSGLPDTELNASDKTITVTADVLNYAVAGLQKNSGSGALSTAATSATLDFGTLASGGSTSAILAALNAALGPADTLGGSWTVTTSDAAFGLSNFGNPLGAIAAGGTGSDLGVSFSTTTGGLHTEVLTLHPLSQDNAPFSGSLPDFTFTINANVAAAVPEPASLTLLLSAAPLLLRRRRKI